MRWSCGYGHYEADTGRFTYTVTKQWRRGELMWHAYVYDNQEEQHAECAQPIPMNWREAQAACVKHKEANDG